MAAKRDAYAPPSSGHLWTILIICTLKYAMSENSEARAHMRPKQLPQRSCLNFGRSGEGDGQCLSIGLIVLFLPGSLTNVNSQRRQYA